MTTAEKIIIKAKALIEEIKQYQNINITYYTTAQEALSPLDLDKLEFCLKNIQQWFDQRELYGCGDYQDLIELLGIIEEEKGRIESRKREAKPLMQFWMALNTWLDDESQDPASLYSEKYKSSYFNFDFDNWYTVAEVDIDKLYKTIYGHSYVEITEKNISIQYIKEYVELYFKEVVELDKGRFAFTVKVNDLFGRFNLPYKLQKGKVIQLGYKTSFRFSRIENYEQFERKIAYASEMILYGEFIDKHSALNYIADAFCYLQSLYKTDRKKFIELVNADNNTNIYKVIKDEIEFVNRIINHDFDIRHNELQGIPKNGVSNNRETLKDPIFVEYLYNRINALLSLLRIKHGLKKKETDELPF